MTDIQKLKALAEAAIEQHDRWVDAGEPWPVWNVRLLEMQTAANPAAVLELIAEVERLQSCEVAYKEFSDKTDWVQETAHWSELGMHRADVLRKRADQLKAENEVLVSALNDILRVTPMGVEAFGIAALVIGELGVSKESSHG